MLAHEAWFSDVRPPFDWAFALSPASLALVAGAVGIAVAWRVVGGRVPRPELPFLRPLGRLAPWVPRLLAVHAGVSLLAQSARGTYLAPSLELPDDPLGAALRIAEGAVGVWLISGVRVRWAALGVALSGPVAMPSFGVVPVLERMDLLAIALFLWLLPPGPDRWGEARGDPAATAAAVLWLRLLTGGALILLAFTEKLARPELARAFLDDFPAFNVLHAVGIDATEDTFIRIAGAVELLFGLLIVSGRLPQVAVIVAGIPFNATLFFLGSEELIGHLPLYGTMLALLVYGSNDETAPLVDRFAGVRPLSPPGPRADERRRVPVGG
jgi:hypothetical protein